MVEDNRATIEVEIPVAFKDLQEALPEVKGVDGFTSSASPVTVRWLGKRNIYVNIGVEEKTPSTCVVRRDNNSYDVTDADVQELADALTAHFQK